MRIAIFGTWHRRAGGPYSYAKAARALGHSVITIGPWQSEETFGTSGRAPDIMLPQRTPRHYAFEELRQQMPWSPQVALLVEGGDDLRVTGFPCPWAHISTEGTNYQWHNDAPKYAEIMCNDVRRLGLTNVEWLPKAYDHDQLCTSQSSVFAAREYDLVQLASARQSRLRVWGPVQQMAPDLHCVFGDLWGPMYDCAYRNSNSTYVCATQSFVTTRVFEAMAMGCVVLADRNPATLELFDEGEHLIGYTPEIGSDGEGSPNLEWLIDTVRKLRRDKIWRDRVAANAYNLVSQKHCYTHRLETVLKRLL